MHYIQRKLLKIIDDVNLIKQGYKGIADIIGVSHPYKVSYHLRMLQNGGFININKKTGKITRIKKSDNNDDIFNSIPILGSANCGIAKNYADEKLEGYLKISKKITPRTEGIMAVEADGNSMDKARVKIRGSEKNIESGDYVIIDTKRNPENYDYVLAIINDCANIKKLVYNKFDKDQIFLKSESSGKHPDIIIHKDDIFLINGVIIDVIKR